MGQRTLSPFAEYFDYAETELIRIKDEAFLYKWHLGLGHLWSIWLDEADQMALTAVAGGGLEVTYPTSVIGTHSTLGDITLTRDSDFQEMLYGAPTRLTLEEELTIGDLVIWDSTDPLVINDFTYPERLTIYVSDSTIYNAKTLTNDRFHTGFNGIKLIGKDLNGSEITEIINVLDDGVYVSRNFWSELSDTPEIDGFNGNVIIGYKQADFDYVLDMYRVGVLDDVEGELRLRLISDNLEFTYLEYFTNRLKRGSDYRRGVVELENDESIGKQVLQNSSDETISPIDLAISYENTKLYVIDSSGYLHVYEHGLTPFGPPQEDIATKKTRIIPIALQPYVGYGETQKLWTYHVRPKNPIAQVQVFKITPSGVTEYLQADYTWSASVYTFLGTPTAPTIVDSWSDLTFENTYDELGQWDFYVKTWEGNDITVAHTAVMVDSMSALVSIDTGIETPTGIFFSEEGYITVTDATKFYKFSEHRDTYFADAERQQLVLREEYTAVEVTS